MAYYDVHSDDGLDEANDLARSAFGDMLLDEDRNLKFRNALRFVINKKHQDGEVAHVIDIGIEVLSNYFSRLYYLYRNWLRTFIFICGRSWCRSSHSFRSISSSCKNRKKSIWQKPICRQNSFDYFTVYRFTQYAFILSILCFVGSILLVPLDDNEKGNILVAEVFDTELIGEGNIILIKKT